MGWTMNRTSLTTFIFFGVARAVLGKMLLIKKSHHRIRHVGLCCSLLKLNAPLSDNDILRGVSGCGWPVARSGRHKEALLKQREKRTAIVLPICGADD
jgi:hypothetical protein